MHTSNISKAKFKHKYQFSYFPPTSNRIYLHIPYDISTPRWRPTVQARGVTSELSFKNMNSGGNVERKKLKDPRPKIEQTTHAEMEV